MLTLSDKTLWALREQATSIVVFAVITTDGGDIFSFSSTNAPLVDGSVGGDAWLDTIQNIHAVTPIAPTLDPLTRRVQTSRMTLTLLDDGALREIVADTALYNASIVLTFASTRFTESGRAPLWGGLIDELVPTDGGMTEIKCVDVIDRARQAKHYGMVQQWHPLELIEKFLVDTGTRAGFIGSASLDPDTDTTISHFCVSRKAHNSTVGEEPPRDMSPDDPGNTESIDSMAQDNGSTTPEILQRAIDADGRARSVESHGGGYNVADSVEALARMCNGSIYADEEGVVNFARFDPSAAVVATWTADDIIEMRQTQAMGQLINEVNVTLGDQPNMARFNHRDTDSQSRYAQQGETVHVSQYALDLPFAGVELKLAAEISSSATSAFFSGVDFAGLAGTRVTPATFREVAASTVFGDVDPWTQPAAAQLSASRKSYIQMLGEVIEVTAMTLAESGSVWPTAIETDRYGVARSVGSFSPYGASMTIARGHSGSASTQFDSARWNPINYYDITAAKFVAESIVERHANGLARMEVHTSLAQYSVQIGDLVAIEDPSVLILGVDGASSANIIKWEIVGKQIDILSANPRIVWRLAYASIAVPPWTSATEDDPGDPEYQRGREGQGSSGSWYDAAGTSISKIAFSTKVGFGSEDYDYANGWDGVDTYTAPFEGIYHVHSQVTMDLDAESTPPAAPWSLLQIAIYKNGSAEKLGPITYNSNPAVLEHAATVTAASLHLAAGDTIDIRVKHGNASATAVTTGLDKTFLTIRKVD